MRKFLGIVSFGCGCYVATFLFKEGDSISSGESIQFFVIGLLLAIAGILSFVMGDGEGPIPFLDEKVKEGSLLFIESRNKYGYTYHYYSITLLAGNEKLIVKDRREYRAGDKYKYEDGKLKLQLE